VALLSDEPLYLLPDTIEDLFTTRLLEYAQFLEDLGLKPPFRWIAGVTGAKHRLLQPPPGPMHVPWRRGPKCLSEIITELGNYDGSQKPTSALLPFFKALYEKCGIPRPDFLPR
jgi:hypothetical protein